MFATGEIVGLTKWIIHDTCLVLLMFGVNIQLLSGKLKFISPKAFREKVGYCLRSFERKKFGNVYVKNSKV